MSVLVISLPLILAEELNLQVDANGNLITGDSFYREFNELNQLVRVREGNTSTGPILEEYIWHPLEERILVKDVFYNGVKNYSIYYVNDNYIHIENSSGNYSEKYIYMDNQLVAFVDTDGNKRFVHSDHLGSVSLVTDINGNVVEETFYSPHGEILEGGIASRFDYEGKEFDSVTKTLDFHFRQCKPEWGCIFFQPDDEINDPYNPQYLNRYSFELNNPYRYTDPEGHYVETAFDIAFIVSDIANINEDPSDITNYLALGADVVGALLPGATGLGLGVKAVDKAVDAGKAGKASSLVGKTGTYKELAKETTGKSGTIQAHHDIEKRFLGQLGYSKQQIDKSPAVILTKTTHQQTTNKFRQAQPYGKQVQTTNEVRQILNRVYKDSKDLLKKASDFIKKNKPENKPTPKKSKGKKR